MQYPPPLNVSSREYPLESSLLVRAYQGLKGLVFSIISELKCMAPRPESLPQAVGQLLWSSVPGSVSGSPSWTQKLPVSLGTVVSLKSWVLELGPRGACVNPLGAQMGEKSAAWHQAL